MKYYFCIETSRYPPFSDQCLLCIQSWARIHSTQGTKQLPRTTRYLKQVVAALLWQLAANRFTFKLKLMDPWLNRNYIWLCIFITTSPELNPKTSYLANISGCLQPSVTGGMIERRERTELAITAVQSEKKGWTEFSWRQKDYCHCLWQNF